jgi:phospholipid/cholesterol/gamma-HCH transport system permease protein
MDGWVYGGFTSSAELLMELKDFIPFHIAYAFIKTFIFAIITTTFFSWILHEGGALEVGKSEHRSFVWTSVCIILLIIY